MKPEIIANNRIHLKQLIKQEIALNGNECNLNHINVCQVNNMNRLFIDFDDFNGDISEWNTSKVENMSFMFYGVKFNGDISKWETSSVKNMSHMFEKSKFNRDIGDWDVSSVVDMAGMFQRSEFNTDISKWNTSNLISMSQLFSCSKFNQDISTWDVSNATDMRGIFSYSAFDKDISNWTPYKLIIDVDSDSAVKYSFNKPLPYWAHYKDINERKKVIDNYQLAKELDKEMDNPIDINKRIKI